MRGQRFSVLRREVERYNVLCFLHALLHNEILPSLPRGARVELVFAVQEQMRELPVRRNPCVVQLALEYVRAENFRDRLQEVLTDDGVLLREDVQRRVLVADTLDDREEGRKVVNVSGVGVYRTCQCLRLVASLQNRSEMRGRPCKKRHGPAVCYD